MDFTVCLSQTSTTDVTVRVRSQDDTATAGQDYIAIDQLVTIPAGAIDQVVSVTILSDEHIEANERLNLVLSEPSGATLGDSIGVGTILNDDTAELPPFERFEGVLAGDTFDLDYHTLLFTPAGDNYMQTLNSIYDLPTDPADGTTLALGADDAVRVDLQGGHRVSLYGQHYGSFYVGSNGTITFADPDTSYYELVENHLSMLRIAVFFDDLDPNVRGRVSCQQFNDRVVVSWFDVSEMWHNNSLTFQAEMYFDGRIRLSWLSINAFDGLVGLSDGGGVRPGLTEQDFSSL
jgi:hypothetical protein